MIETCPLCSGDLSPTFYRAKGMPVFQNVIYQNDNQARLAPVVNIELTRCCRCGCVLNRGFNEAVTHFDETYDNDQMFSRTYQIYLGNVLRMLENQRTFRTVVEIGCGQGGFVRFLRERGYDATGFDPSYKGSEPWIVKDYFRPGQQQISADLIVLRHVLECIPAAFSLLRETVRANGGRGHIFIEAPDFEWTASHHAFWNIFGEYCYYFTRDTLRRMFASCTTGSLFEGKYLYVLGSSADLLQIYDSRRAAPPLPAFAVDDEIERYRRLLHDNAPCALWGAAGKGVTFANLFDPDRRLIRFLVDVNPRKSGTYIPGSGHPIVAPEDADFVGQGIRGLFIMNPAYKDEIEGRIGRHNLRLIAVGT